MERIKTFVIQGVSQVEFEINKWIEDNPVRIISVNITDWSHGNVRDVGDVLATVLYSHVR